MSGFEKFDMLASFASPPKTKRKRSTVKSKNSSEKRPNKVLKSSNTNISLLPLKPKDTISSSKNLDASLVTRSTTGLSRTNLEQKYDSPEKSMINNLSCNEEEFSYPATKAICNDDVLIDDDDDSEPFQFTQEEIKIQKIPQSLNTRLLNRIQSFMRPVQYEGMTEKFRILTAKIKADNVKQLEYSQYDEIRENERKIRVMSIAISSNEVTAKFQFLDNDENPINDGKENFMSLNSKIYEEILKNYQKFIVRVEHTVEIEVNVSMHYLSHLRAY